MSGQPPNDSPLAGTITVAVAARLLKRDGRVVRRLIDELQIKAYRIGNRWEIIRSSLIEHIERQSNFARSDRDSMPDATRRSDH
jgi:excisionase family DNA binding protein